MKPIVLFKSNAFDRSWPDVGSDPNEPPLGKDLAESLEQKFATYGVTTNVIVEATGGWEFEVTLDGEHYIFFVHWAAVGEPPEDFWVVQARKKKGLRKFLLGRSQDPAVNVQPALDLLRCIIENSSDMTDVRWVDANEFAQIY